MTGDEEKYVSCRKITNFFETYLGTKATDPCLASSLC